MNESKELLALARVVLTDAPRQVGADRSLASALLVRQALEESLDSWWDATLPGMAETRDRAQQITLPFYVDAQLAGNVRWAWNRLSTICHHHAYDQAPPVAEIESLVEAVARIVQELPKS